MLVISLEFHPATGVIIAVPTVAGDFGLGLVAEVGAGIKKLQFESASSSKSPWKTLRPDNAPTCESPKLTPFGVTSRGVLQPWLPSFLTWYLPDW